MKIKGVPATYQAFADEVSKKLFSHRGWHRVAGFPPNGFKPFVEISVRVFSNIWVDATVSFEITAADDQFVITPKATIRGADGSEEFLSAKRPMVYTANNYLAAAYAVLNIAEDVYQAVQKNGIAIPKAYNAIYPAVSNALN